MEPDRIIRVLAAQPNSPDVRVQECLEAVRRAGRVRLRPAGHYRVHQWGCDAERHHRTESAARVAPESCRRGPCRYDRGVSEIDTTQAYKLIHLFGAPFISYISGDEVVPTELEQSSQGLPPNVNEALARLDEFREYAATKTQPLTFMVDQAALQGYFDDWRAALGGELAELSTDDTVVATISKALRRLSTLILKFSEPLGALHDRPYPELADATWDDDAFAEYVAEYDRFRLQLRENLPRRRPKACLGVIWREHWALGTAANPGDAWRCGRQIRGCALVVGMPEDRADMECLHGIATVLYFAVMNGIGILQNLEAGAIDAYPLTDLCADMVAPQDRPAINGTTGQIMGYALEVKHRRLYKRGDGLPFSESGLRTQWIWIGNLDRFRWRSRSQQVCRRTRRGRRS
jgi:hypothetical protein